MKKKLVEIGKVGISISDLDGWPFEEAKAYLDSKHAEVLGQYKNTEAVKVKVEQYGYDGGVDVSLVAHRYETDEEFELRLQDAKKVVDTKKKRELAELARLKAKYEGGGDDQ